MSYPQAKLPTSDELIDKHSKAEYICWNGRFSGKPRNSTAREQVKRYK